VTSTFTNKGEHREFITFDRNEVRAVAPNYADLMIKQLEVIGKLEVSRPQMQVMTQMFGLGQTRLRWRSSGPPPFVNPRPPKSFRISWLRQWIAPRKADS
jgi:hypothetical protein